MYRFATAFVLTCLIASPAHAAEPVSVGWMVWTYGSAIFIGLAALFTVLSKRRSAVNVPADVPVVRHTPMFNETLLTTMFHTARLDGDIDQITLQAMVRSYKNLTGTPLTQAMITARYAVQTDTVDLLSIMPQFVGIEQDVMMKGCIDVAAADGEIQKPEHDFLMALGAALGLDGDMFRNQVRDAMRPTSRVLNPAMAAA